MPSLSPTATIPGPPAAPKVAELLATVVVDAPQQTLLYHLVAYRFKNVTKWNISAAYESREAAELDIAQTAGIQEFAHITVALPL